MGSKSKPEVPAYTGGITRIAGRDVATNTKEGNNIVTTYNPSAGVQEANTFVESQLAPLYKSAMTPQDFGSYADAYKQNQLDDLNNSYRQSLNAAKGALVSSGQSSSSQGLDQLQAFNKPYMQQQANINAQAPLQAQQMQSNQQNLATSQMSNAINALNNYYNTGNSFMGTASNASTSGNNYNQWAYPYQLDAYNTAQKNQTANTGAMINAGGQIAAASLPYVLASDKNVKKNIVKIGEKNGINIYEFDYKTDKYGVLTDSIQFMGIYPECTNISVGYQSEHTFNESQDIEHLEKLAVACTKVDWIGLPVERDPSKVEYKSYGYGAWGAYDDDYYGSSYGSRYGSSYGNSYTSYNTKRTENIWFHDKEFNYVSKVEVETYSKKYVSVDLHTERLDKEKKMIEKLLKSLELRFLKTEWDGIRLVVDYGPLNHTSEATRNDLIEFIPELDYRLLEDELETDNSNTYGYLEEMY